MTFVRRHDRTPPPGAKMLRQGNTRSTVLLPGLGVVKLLRRVRTREMLAALFAPSAFAREFDLTQTAAAHGIPAPAAVFSAERRTCGVLREAALMVEAVPDAASLQETIEGCFPRPGVEREVRGNVRRLCTKLGSLLARLHKAGGVHGDSSPDNVLVRGANRDELVLIDWAFALFADEAPPDGGLARRLRMRGAAERYPFPADEIAAALRGYAADGVMSPAFEALRGNDVERAVNALLQCGAPLREMLACLEGYYRELGLGGAEKRRMVEHIARSFPAALRQSIRRTLRNADRSSRQTVTVRRDRILLSYRRSAPPAEARAAFAEDAPTVAGAAVERRDHPEALRVWRNACALARFHLPARLHLACRSEPGGAGALLLEHAAERFESPAKISPRRLARFVRLLHAFGFRFGPCQNDAIIEQPASLGPFGFRQGSGYVLNDAGAVAFRPEEPVEDSVRAVASWVRHVQTEAAAGEFLAQAFEPTRFHL